MATHHMPGPLQSQTWFNRVGETLANFPQYALLEAARHLAWIESTRTRLTKARQTKAGFLMGVNETAQPSHNTGKVTSSAPKREAM